MCRSIRTLRPPYTEDAGEDDIRAAALQYVRKISGFRAPAAHNRAAFDEAVEAVAAATRDLLDALEVRGRTAPGAGNAPPPR
ncbi:DUF2277 domain-containing protein [Streptomyces sp. WAC 00631]|uniref:DUF2277 domain-containing protein n=1 Tax=unclassified Streptomyces TaxID=2593676 RepID=UPI000F77D35A|nr:MULTISPECIES: DUF2277 domain-containing protein [unclassified Streptomyces]MCC5037141.1 DUF2277 domain-containing protein [Streptomyces sp. WAC 00631]MCC9737743.1 DUF2277 domain-containing protein [Streptomyces sp. MNU89]